MDMCKNPTIPRGTDSTNVLQDGPLQAQPALPVLPHSRRPGNDFVRDQLGHGNITDLTRTEALGAVAAHPGSVLLEGAAVTAEDQTRFHLTTGLAVTKPSLASFVEQENKNQLGRAALTQHNYPEHVLGMRTPALVTATPVSHQRPQAAPAAADTTQVLPVGTWGLGLAPRAAGMAPPAVLAAAATAAAGTAAVAAAAASAAATAAAPAAAAAGDSAAVAPAPVVISATRKEKHRLLMQNKRKAESEEETARRLAKKRNHNESKKKEETPQERDLRNAKRREKRKKKNRGKRRMTWHGPFYTPLGPSPYLQVQPNCALCALALGCPSL